MRGRTGAAIAGGLFLAGWIAWGVYSTRSTEAVPFEHREQVGRIELRQYPETVLAETTAPDQRTAFRRLFRYISGANTRDESVSMPAPVETHRTKSAGGGDTQRGESVPMTAPVRSASTASDQIRMAFYLPEEYDLESAPEPLDSTVELTAEPPKTVAVRRFSWYTPKWRVRRQERKLRATLDRAGIEPTGECTLLRYNDPWTPPFMRRNEVTLEVTT